MTIIGTMTAALDWGRIAVDPVALVILPGPNHKGFTFAKRERNGRLAGVANIPDLGPHDAAPCLAAWIKDAGERGLAVEDHAGARAVVREFAQHLIDSVRE